jgi:diguanylate cyclase (GGDEF)-like protein
MDKVDMRRAGVLAASYLSLPLLGLMAYATENIHVGALAVIPILFIAYYLRPYASLLTAFIAGVGLGLADQRPPDAAHVVDIPPLMDALVLSICLSTIVLVANRLRETAIANQTLHGRLQKARRDAELDALTGIPNRKFFMMKLDEAIARASLGESYVAVLFCDLDGFKTVNDTSGHSAGDQVLRLAAIRLLNAVRTIDTVARIGGDEFAILLERMHDAQEALHVTGKVEQSFRDPFHVRNKRHVVGVTVGVSLYPEDGSRAETLLHAADARMYRSKNGKRTGNAHSGVTIVDSAAYSADDAAERLPHPSA